MTKRSEMQHRRAELKAKMMGHVANRLFTHKETGVDGFVKRMILKEKPRSE